MTFLIDLKKRKERPYHKMLDGVEFSRPLIVIPTRDGRYRVGIQTARTCLRAKWKLKKHSFSSYFVII